MTLPEMQDVYSSNVARIGYDERFEEVYVEFNSGRTYVYSGVPRVVFEDFERAGSKGGFLNEILKPGYLFRPL
jgi:hypothetical protein